jgi:hypothetical protein
MSDQTTASPIEQARSQFASEQLPFPEIPYHLAQRLRAVGEHLFTTAKTEMGPYMLGAYSGPVLDNADHEDFAVIGFDGHGINSWAVHYYLVERGLALFLQRPWGGAYTDPDEARAPVEQAFAWAARLRAAVKQAVDAGLIPAGWRLAVVLSAFGSESWGWVPSPSPGFDDLDWHADGDVQQDALRAVTDLIEGKTKLG